MKPPRRKLSKKILEEVVGSVRVKIYTRTRPDGYRVFQVADYSSGARQLRTYATEDTARKEANRIARLLSAGEAHAARFSGKDAASYGRALELLRSTGLPLEIAASHFAEAVKILGGDRVIEAAKFFAERNLAGLPPKTVAELVTELISHKQARKKSVRYIEDLRSRLGRFAEAFQGQVSSVTSAEVQDWLDGMRAEPQTVANFRRVAYTLFAFAESRGFIHHRTNPVEHTEKPENRKAGSIEIYTPDELSRLLGAATEDFLPSLAIQAFAGLRSAEVERLDWSDVDLDSGIITVSASKAKTASRRVVPILPALASWLRAYSGRPGRVWDGPHHEFYDRQQQTADATVIAADPGRDITATPAVSWKANALRHSFISYRLAEIQNANQVALEAGNSPAVVFKHYRELVKPADAKAWFSIQREAPANVITTHPLTTYA